MKLYDSGRAPNPRRVRIFLSEKAVKLPTEQVDLGAMLQKSAAFTAINPLQRVPALVLDDGTVIAESIAICRYIEVLHPDPPLFGRGAVEGCALDMEPAANASVVAVSHVLATPGDEGHGSTAKCGLGRSQQAAHRDFSPSSTASWRAAVRRQRNCLGGRHHRTGCPRLHEAGQLISDACANVRRWHADLAARASARPDHAGDHRRLRRRFQLGGRFNTCFYVRSARERCWWIAGASSLVALKACGLDHGNVEGIILTHLHGDHSAGCRSPLDARSSTAANGCDRRPPARARATR